MLSIVEDLLNLFKNKQLNSEGSEYSFVDLVRQKKITEAIDMMSCFDDDVDLALKEYYPDKHVVNNRPNKRRKKGTPYISAKLPRKRQQYINEVALFFLLNNPIKWTKKSGSDEAYAAFTKFLENTHYNAKMRQLKRIAGAETECAKLYHVYRDQNNKPDCRVVVLARSTGYKLRHMIDQYGKMQAFAYGYTTKTNNRSVEHWDIQTSDFIFNCTKRKNGWEVEVFDNPTGKINIVYAHQKKEWDGVQARCDREEDVDSRQADNNNYFSDPIAKASADVIKSMVDPQSIGKFIQLSGKDSHFEYINPPQVSDGWRTEKEDLKSSILNDSFSPDFSYESIKGYGTLTGAALRNALTIGYIKRNLNIEVYEELVARDKSVILSVLKILHAELDFDSLDIVFEFADPFTEDKQTLWNALSGAKSSGIISTETAVSILGLTADNQLEVDRIKQQENPTVPPMVQAGEEETVM